VKFIGLMLTKDDGDVLHETLPHNLAYLDALYILDGTAPRTNGVPSTAMYTHEADLPGEYTGPPCDGWRQFLYEQAVADHGYTNWFLLIHSDELWTTDPRLIVDNQHDGYIFQLPFFFPRVGEQWDYFRSPLEQLHWHLGPGWPEFRMFRGSPETQFQRNQHFNVTPSGITNMKACCQPILHFPYRAPESQKHRANSTFDPDNYAHVRDRSAVYWNDDMIAEQQKRQWFPYLLDRKPADYLPRVQVAA
jgi:hypothetical protein